MSTPETLSANNRFRFLTEATVWLYRSQGVFARLMVREKLLDDPFYRELLASNCLPTEGVALDLGCGRGVFLALWARALALGMAGGQQRGGKPRLLGIDNNAEAAESARLALAGDAEIITGDIRSETLPNCRLAIVKDVLLFLEPDEQVKLLGRIAGSLDAGGCIILREPDAAAWGYWTVGKLPGNPLGLIYGDRKQRLYPRSSVEWKDILQSFDLQVDNFPINNEKLFLKTWFLARKIE